MMLQDYESPVVHSKVFDLMNGMISCIKLK